MVIRYKHINIIGNLLLNDSYFSYWLNNTIFTKFSNIKYSVISLMKFQKNINFFRYFFWIYYFYNLNKNFNIYIYIKFYKYILNFIYLLNYLKQINYKYYNFYYIKKINLSKVNKKLIKNFLNYLIIEKKIKLFFFFNNTNLNFNLLGNLNIKDNIIIYNLNIFNINFFYFFFYLNFSNK